MGTSISDSYGWHQSCDLFLIVGVYGCLCQQGNDKQITVGSPVVWAIVHWQYLSLCLAFPNETWSNKMAFLLYMQLAEKELQPLLPRPARRRNSYSDIHEKFVNTSVNVLVHMLLSPNPIVPSISLDRFDSKYVTMDLWDFEAFKDAAGVRNIKPDGQRIAAFKRPILLTCTYQTVRVEQGYVRMDLTAFCKP